MTKLHQTLSYGNTDNRNILYWEIATYNGTCLEKVWNLLEQLTGWLSSLEMRFLNTINSWHSHRSGEHFRKFQERFLKVSEKYWLYRAVSFCVPEFLNKSRISTTVNQGVLMNLTGGKWHTEYSLNMINSEKYDSSGGEQKIWHSMASFLYLTSEIHENKYELWCNGTVMITRHYWQFPWTNWVKF